ncbi:glyoxalase/bleomycin resistance/dioxygenase family protein [Ensifer sp. ENS01]|uniref:glyoxalase/bleomycin resistance/dioxygenase family protein n=1 Tax=Ensifer sp. ENS01 TaxID=2769293 RepID=UPI000DD946F8|nr:glyoxalase/bleomycin resistance/dioxygenase family protein [Ensifer sp. ENS01]MBD9494528.1 glyoxalase/bleomycin resistance/dioxygenase family protein [Ensifer sp. ENS01]
MADGVAAILVHVADTQAGLVWYQRAFPDAEHRFLAAFDFSYLRIGTIDLEIVQADEKVASGAAGSVVYWAVANLDRALAHFEALGAVLYRGPMAIQEGLWMCQVRDPWGNCIGLRGPRPGEGGIGNEAEF